MTQIVDALAPSPPITSLSDARTRAIASLVDFALRFQSQVAYRTAIAADIDGNLLVGGAQADRRIYVQLGAVGGERAEATFDQYLPKAGDAILLTRPRMFGLGGWLVLGWLRGATDPCYSTVDALA